jgi:5'-nucleotidase
MRAAFSIVLLVFAGACKHARAPVEVQLLSFNDFHGHLEPPGGGAGAVLTSTSPRAFVDAGGAVYFAAHLARLRAENPNTLVVSAGDLIGASPLISGGFHDEPTIEAMNAIGLDLNAVGNHELDEGPGELLRMQAGGCHPVDGCQDGDPFAGARFKFLAANVLTARKETLFPRYEIRTFDGVSIAFIGMTLEGTAEVTAPNAVEGLTFLDEASTVNAIVPELVARGVQAIVLLIHEGGLPTGLYDGCSGISGPIVEIAGAIDPEIDLIISGHTHQAYNCMIGGRPVTSAMSFGRLITRAKLAIDPDSGDVVSASAENLIVTRDVVPDREISALISKYSTLIAPIRDRVIGAATEDLSADWSLGHVIADGQLEATRSAGAQIAFMNPGGIRADLDAGPITYGEIFTVHPFGNNLVVMTLTGAQIEQLLEQQFSASGVRILQPSRGFTYAYSPTAPLGSKVEASSLMLDGAVIAPERSYRVTVNSFLAMGGDGFGVLAKGTDRVGGPLDADALERYLATHTPISAPPANRVTVAP